jgi:hypothetical protein
MPGNDSYTVDLLNFEGNDEGATYTDEAFAGTHAWTPIGVAASVKTDTAQYKFGSSSLRATGATACIGTPTSSDFAFGTGDFTIDFFIKFGATGPAQGVWGSFADTNNLCQLYFFGDTTSYIYKWLLYHKNDGTVRGHTICTNALPDPGITNWHHVAWVRQGGTAAFYFDGAPTAVTQTNAWTTVSAIGATYEIAACKNVAGAQNFSNAWIDSFRVSKGIARWTATFTPPTSAYGADRTKSLGDTFSLGDSISNSPGPVKADTISTADAIQNTPRPIKADIFSLGDAISNRPSPIKADVLSLGDSVFNNPRLLKADVISLSDVLVKSFYSNLADVISLTDDLVKRFNLSTSDGISLLDFFSYILVSGLSGETLACDLSDDIYMSDIIIKSMHLFKTDAMSVIDQITKSTLLNKQDIITLADLIAKKSEITKQDVIVLSDIISTVIPRQLAEDLIYGFVHHKRTMQKGEQGGDFGFIHTKRIMSEGETGGDFSFTHKKRSKN